jgi:nucleoside-diphosphate-sugar epimerase
VSRRALVLGGTGAIGSAIARRLLERSWQVDVVARRAGREAEGAGFYAADRDDGAALRRAYGDGADLLVDCIAYTAAQARLIVPLALDAASTVQISSKAVYVDAHGHHSNSSVRPVWPEPIKESQPTLPPGDMPYDSAEGYGPNKVAAERALLDSGAPASILRVSKVHGARANPPREWFFVKRALDGRTHVLLAHHGRGGDHTTAAANIATLVELCAERPGARILNVADPDAPTGLDIARAVAAHLRVVWEEVLLDDAAPAGLGSHPWDTIPPIVLDLSAAYALGWQPAGSYAATVGEALDWLVAERPDLGSRMFDYTAEDAFLARSSNGTTTGTRRSG